MPKSPNRTAILRRLVKRFKPPLRVTLREDIGDRGAEWISATVTIPKMSALFTFPIGFEVPGEFIADGLYNALSAEISRSLRLKPKKGGAQ